ncbi:MAG: pitrilysin family protein [Longimicrobiales bacterium]
MTTTSRQLANGLTVVIREDHSAPVIAVVTYVKAGYFDETDDVIGISHVLEHLYFKGTPRRGAGEIARETKAVGGYLNAGTIYDHTSYYTVLPSASLERALDIQSDALLNSAIDEGELRTELQVIIQEARRKLDNPSAVAEESLFELLFDHHRIRRWRIGHADALALMTREQIWRYYRGMYTPANTVVTVAGDVDTGSTFALVEKYYGGMAAGPDARVAGPVEPERSGFRFREMSGDVVQTAVQWGWRTPGSLHPDTPALDVLSLVIGQGRASRLYRGVREAGLVTGISAHNYTPTQVGVFGISADVEPPRTMEALRAIAGVIRSVRDDGITQHEVERARSILEARMVRRQETVEGQANLLAEWEALGGWKKADEYMQRVLSVTADELMNVARKYLTDDGCALLLYRPAHAATVELNADALFAFDADAIAVAPKAAAMTRQEVKVSAPRALAPERVENGIRFYATADAHIVIMPRHAAPLVSMSVVFRGGTLHESAGEAGITGLMARTSVKGTERRTAAQLADESEAIGTSIGFGVGADSFAWAMTAPSRHFATGLDLLLDAALAPTFPAAEVAKESGMLLSDLQQMRDDMYQYPLQLALEAAFGAHPYGFGPRVVEQAVRNIDASMLQSWHRARVLHGEPWFFVVGDVTDPDAAASRIAEKLSVVIHDGLTLPDRRPVWPIMPQVHAERRNKQQTAIALAFPGPERNHPDVDALRLLSSSVSGLGGRLFEELRSKRSLAYSISAFPLARWRAGAFIAYIGTSPEREAEARDGLIEQLGMLTTSVLDDAEVERAKEYTIGSWQIRIQTNAALLGDLVSAILLGTGLEEILGFEKRVRAITGEQMRAALARCIDPSRVVEGVVRGGAALEEDEPAA